MERATTSLVQAAIPVGSEKEVTAVRHYDFLDGIRACLALYVVAHHARYTVLDYNGAQTVSRGFMPLNFGHGAVCFFLILSGFCLMLPTLKKEFNVLTDTGSFLKRRAWRILPPYYLAAAFSLLLIYAFIPAKTGTHWDLSLPVTLHNVVTHLLLVQNWVPADYAKINHVFWSIAVEWQIYFFFPLFLIGWRFMGGIGTTLAVIAASTLIENEIRDFAQLAPSVNFLGLFVMGMFAAYVSFSRQAAAVRFRIIPWRAIAACAGLIFLAVYRVHKDLAVDMTFGLFAMSLLIVIALHPEGWLHGLLDFKPLVFIGSFSYSLYLIHAPLLQVLWQYPLSPLKAHPNLMCAALIAIGLPVCVLVSYAFFLCCERPFLRRKNVAVVHVP